ncbi:MAG: hypothetical protein ACYTBP_06305 [Planctomycetota bacterium]|jgi:hypothetical protein
MAKQLNEREKKVLKIGAVCAAAILVFTLGSDWLGHWGRVRMSLASARAQLNSLNLSEAKREGLLEIVPVFEMPLDEEGQKFLFRQKLNEQLKKAQVKGDPLKFLSVTKSPCTGYGLLRLQCRRGKTKFDKALDLLAGLKENPYLMGIEEFSLTCGEKNKNEVEVDITVSTFVRTTAIPERLGGI